MHKLCLMTADELQQIFGPLFELLPLHEGQVCHVQHVMRELFCIEWLLAGWLLSAVRGHIVEAPLPYRESAPWRPQKGMEDGSSAVVLTIDFNVSC